MIVTRRSVREYTIPTILRVAKKSTPGRVTRRLDYSSNYLLSSVDTSYMSETGNLLLEFLVGDYTVSIEFIDFLLYLRMNYFDNRLTRGSIVDTVDTTVQKALKSSDIRVNCSCPDFKYRYAYVASQYDMKYGPVEVRPAHITNPKMKGRVCKHVLAVLLRSSKYKIKLYRSLGKFIRTNWRT